jgi:hypothetical protein
MLVPLAALTLTIPQISKHSDSLDLRNRLVQESIGLLLTTRRGIAQNFFSFKCQRALSDNAPTWRLSLKQEFTCTHLASVSQKSLISKLKHFYMQEKMQSINLVQAEEFSESFELL